MDEEVLTAKSSVDDDIPPHKEFHIPTQKEVNKISEDLTYITLTYNYSMMYDIPPRNVILKLNGSYDRASTPRLTYKIIRPDGKDIKLLDRNLGNENLDLNINTAGSTSCRDSIYQFGRNFETDSPTNKMEIDPVKVMFGKSNDNILSNPDVLKGDYKLKVMMFADNLNMNYGDEKTELEIISLPPKSVKDFSAVYEDDKVKLEWKAPEDIGGSDIIEYRIYRADSNRMYRCIGNVSGKTNSFYDDGKNTSEPYEEIEKNQVYFYKVIPINSDTFHIGGKSLESEIYYPFERSHTEPVLVLTSSKDKKKDSTGAYMWKMDYSFLNEEYIEGKMDGVDVQVNDISGKGLCMYKIKSQGTEDGLKKYSYKGGYYSKGNADIEMNLDKDTSFEIEANVKKSSIEFSGDLWVNDSIKGLEKNNTGFGIRKQTLQSSGDIDMNYTLNYSSKYKEQSTSVDLKMDWNMNLSMDYDEPRFWFSPNSYDLLATSISDCNYTGNITGNIDLDMEMNGWYSNESKHKDRNLSRDIDSSMECFGGTSSVGYRRVYSPILGNAKVGFNKILGDTVGIGYGNGVYGDIGYSEKEDFWYAMTTNDIQVRDKEKGLYSQQYLDPTAMPGLLSILECSFVKANTIENKELIESQISENVRAELESLPDNVNSSAYRKERIKELRKMFYSEFITEPFWEIRDQQAGVDGTEPKTTLIPVTDVVGFVGSESVDKGEVDRFLKNKQGYKESSIDNDEDSSVKMTEFITTMIALVIIIMAATWYRSKN